jgi:hypothetical protein
LGNYNTIANFKLETKTPLFRFFWGEIQAKRDKIRLWVQTRMSEGDPEQPPKKKFSPKFNLPVIEEMLMIDTGDTCQQFLGKSLRNLKTRSIQTNYVKWQ